jgi:Tfp pilus assembly protein FimT
MTLIEIMVVIVIMALATAGVTMALGALTRTKLRSGCARVVAAARFSYSRAISTGNTVRILIDVDEGTMAIEEAHGRVTLSRLDDPRREASEEAGEDPSAVDPWVAARQRLETTIQPSFGSSPFAPIAGRNGETLRKYQTQPLSDGVRVVRLVLPHEPEPRDSGKGAIYFFPGGQTENAVVQLGDRSDTVFSVEIHPLTGRATVHDFAFEPEPIRESDDEEDLSEVEDPGA